jgi:mono/diheme cytochrome c family protein
MRTSLFPSRTLLCVVVLAVSTSLLCAASGDGLWMARVPEKARVKPNPFDSNPTAQAAGAKLFGQNCSSCHGDNGLGKNNHPSLRTDRIRAATPGELEWLLTNGSMKNGMPSWSRLPEQQRWQIVSFLKSLQ